MPGTPQKNTVYLFSKFLTGAMGLHYRSERLGELEQKIADACGEFGFDDPEACMLWLMSAPLSREQQDTLAHFLTIGETYFFRDRQSYHALEKEILPELIRARRKGEKRLRIWSAGCSSGEEPYSIAILLSRILPDLDGWNITLLATDINPGVLEKGRQGIYGQWSFRDAPPWLMEYFTQCEDGRYQIIPRIRAMVQFEYLNLAEESYPALFNNTNAIDVIFCRNVMLYLEPALIAKISERFHRALQEGGWLFVSPTEAMHQTFSGFVRRQFPGALAFRKGGENATGGVTRPGVPPFSPPATDSGTTAASSARQLQDAPSQPFRAEPALPPPSGDREPRAETPPATAYEEACAHYRNGCYELAAGKAREFLETKPESIEAMELLTRAYANLGRFAEARHWCEESLASDRLRAATHYLLAIILQEQGLMAEAAASFNRALYVDHDFLLAYFALGNLHLQSGRKDEARRNFANALRLLDRRDPHETLEEAEGMTAGRLAAIIRAMNRREDSK